MHGEEEMNSTSTLDVWYDQKNNFINAHGQLAYPLRMLSGEAVRWLYKWHSVQNVKLAVLVSIQSFLTL